MRSEKWGQKMMTLISQVEAVLKGVVPAIGVALALWFGMWLKGVKSKEKKNAINEIDFAGKKISFDVHAKPIDDLVAESNKSHGTNGVVPDSGDSDPKGG